MKRLPNNLHASVRQWIFLGFAVSVFISCAASADAPATAPSPNSTTLWLKDASFTEKLNSGRLQRELFRQGVLIAARDGLGLSTRDEALREWREDPPVPRTLIPKIDARTLMLAFETPSEGEVPPGGPDAGAGLTPQAENEPAGTPIAWSVQLKRAQYSQDIVSTAAAMEVFSRTKFVQALQQSGFSGTGNLEKLDAPAPDDAESRLAKLEALSQFAVLRETHQLIRTDGESQQRLGVLVRGYANLGQITRFHWSMENKVYFARSLLYANRMVATAPESTFALWHRAYALAFAGMQDAAMRDIESAKRLGGAPAPTWSVLLEPYCKYQTKQLTDLGNQNPSLKPLAAYLAFVTVENSGWGCKTFPIQVGQAAMQSNPDCLQVLDSMCDRTGVGLVFDLVEQSKRSFSRTMGTELEKMPGFPSEVGGMIDGLRREGGNPGGREKVCEALIDAGTPDRDVVEPSWCALGRLIQETTFAQVSLEQEVTAVQLNGDAAGYASQVAPWVAGHPYHAIIDAYIGARDKKNKSAPQSLEAIDVENLTVAAYPMLRLAEMLEPAGAQPIARIRKAITSNTDLTSFDLSRMILAYRNDLDVPFVTRTAARLRAVDANSPLALAVSIQTDWDHVGQQAGQIESRQGDQPTIALALGREYSALAQWENAQRCLESYIAVSPDLTGYRLLADAYKSQGNMDMWLSTLERYLNSTPDVDLSHAQVQVDIANYYMDKKQFDKALPYADAAAQTGAEWAMNCDARAHAAIGDATGAQQLHNENQERYSRDQYAVFESCVLSGQGDRAAAAQQARAEFEEQEDQLNGEELARWAGMETMENDNAAAIKVWQQRMSKFPGPLSGLHIALLADAGHDFVARDAEFKIIAQLPDQGSTMCRFAAILRDTLAAGDNAIPDANAIESTVANSTASEQVSVYYLAARYMDLHGHKDLAIPYLKKCCMPGPLNRRRNVDQLLAYDALRSQGIDPLALEAASTRPTGDY